MNHKLTTHKYIFLLISCLITCSNKSRENLIISDVVAFTWSPDSDKVAYVRHYTSEPIGSNGKKTLHTRLYIRTLGKFEKDILVLGKDTCLYGIDWFPDSDIIIIDSRISGHDDGYSHIWMYPIDRCKPPRQLTKDDCHTSYPAISPDGEYITFESYSNKKQQSDIYVMSIHNDSIISMTTNGASPQWHPDGKHIVFTALNESTYFDILSLDIITGEVDPIVKTKDREYWGSYSPDAQYLSFVRVEENKTLSLNVLEVQSNKQYQFPDVEVFPFAPPTWHPDGNRILFLKMAKENDINAQLVSVPFNKSIFEDAVNSRK